MGLFNGFSFIVIAEFVFCTFVILRKHLFAKIFSKIVIHDVNLNMRKGIKRKKMNTNRTKASIHIRSQTLWVKWYWFLVTLTGIVIGIVISYMEFHDYRYVPK